MRVERLKTEFDIDLTWTHFPLHPSTPEAGLTLEQLFAGRQIDIPASKARMVRLMAEEGLAYGDRTMTYNSRLAQEMAKWAESAKGAQGVHNAFFRAYFVDGLNLGDISVLVRIAGQLGLNEEEAFEVLRTRSSRESVDADWRRSQRLGVTAVPTFRVDKQVAAGAHPYDMLEKFVVNAGAKKRRS